MIDNSDISLRVFTYTFHAQNVVDSQFAFKECKQFIQRSVREKRSAVIRHASGQIRMFHI